MVAQSMNADSILSAVRQAGIPLIGVRILDPLDASTWKLFGPLTEDQRTQAIAIIVGLLAAPTSLKPLISKINFLRLLKPAEYAAFIAGGTTDPILLHGQALLDAAIVLTPTEPSFVQQLAYCVTKGILTPARAAAIVAGMQG